MHGLAEADPLRRPAHAAQMMPFLVGDVTHAGRKSAPGAIIRLKTDN
jgi:hypothetical protein